MKQSFSRGFTLVELLIVIAILAVLATVILPKLNSARDLALEAKARSEIGEVVSAMALLYDDTGEYSNGAGSYCRSSVPSDNEVDLSSDDAGLLANGTSLPGWDGPYLQSAVDPWGTPYYLDEDYQCMASTTGCQGIIDTGNDSSVVVSCGPNKAVGTDSCEYDADNIVYRLCDTS